MEIRGLGTHNDNMWAHSSTGNTPNTYPMIYSAHHLQIGHLFGIFLKKALITCPMSMPNATDYGRPERK